MISTLFSMAQTVPNVQWANYYSTQSSVLGLPTVPAAIDVDRNVYISGLCCKSGFRIGLLQQSVGFEDVFSDKTHSKYKCSLMG